MQSRRVTLLCCALALVVSCCALASSGAHAATLARVAKLRSSQLAPAPFAPSDEHSLLGVQAAAAATTAAPAAAPAGGGMAINVKTTAIMKDPITNMLESKWVWVFFVFLILIVVCIIAYCFREYVAVCVACLETCIYHSIKAILFPLKVLLQIFRLIFYPLKQGFLAGKDRCTRYLYPAEMRVAGLRY